MDGLTEKDLKDLGFKKAKGEGFYYFVYEFGKFNSALDLISSASDERPYQVTISEGNLKPLTKSQVKKYIDLINSLI